MGKVLWSESLTPWLMGIRYVDFKDKTEAVQEKVRYMLDRTGQMFKINGLPDTMPEYMIKNMIQANGHIAGLEYKGDFYGITGTFGGEPDPYYRGTEYVVANPAMPDLKTYYIPGKNCVVIKNDHLMLGLIPLCRRYASMLVENELSIIMELVTGRANYIIGAGSDGDKLAADDFIRQLWRGDLSAVLENRFIDGIKVNPGAVASSSRLSQLIEANQFITAKWFNELGLDSNYNMKRESLTANEVDMNSDSLLPLVDDMLISWREGFNDFNEMFGTNITVELASSWKDNDKQIHIDENAQDEPEQKGDTENEQIN